ncbi:DNA mismatch repair protein MutS [Leptospira santarosai]|uniref:DNA mismatch repair protein MutS n=1 Tax=Leptospira santarosai serovar Arenal str. MAVJ 401 TaxID=1049976 RepID=M6JVF8_9LEPT|nr:DNA mismatch repair protein MutS [Leptospira santarosai]AVV80268.1 DNA mismatch repair protein MutS [Leptospira santarosai]EMF91830.1 DNA mismatch repair protein MutS [Leptospira santarosai str. ST188]EMN23523.1 DNA mismatch repair protein MutS [Leptospira santarosai serovar Arenal str. MAVJ 401]MDI7185494.1 DNA mismatch repair protein MutS [Leptospira santarosai]MDI7199363.1 DNA mismatch repair protein MutS [Leptospira santarosai]
MSFETTGTSAEYWSDLADALNTPMMKQFLTIKKDFPDTILFFRMGDFYEMFLEDAKIASSILDIALTKRQNAVPMCGIPYHSKDNYISRLLNAGKKIAICEQSKPEETGSKLMTRDVVRIITPGTVIEENLLTGFQNNYLAVLHLKKSLIYFAMADFSTGELFYSSASVTGLEKLVAELEKFRPSEICVPQSERSFFQEFEYFKDKEFTILKDQPETSEKDPFQILSRYLNEYIRETHRDNKLVLREPRILSSGKFLEMDRETILNLELVENDKEKNHTLYSIFNFCNTARGKRLLKQRILFPECDPIVLYSRWEKQDILLKTILAPFVSALRDVGDIERILTRFRGNHTYPRDFRSILNSISTGMKLKKQLETLSYPFLIPSEELKALSEFIEERLHPGDDLPVILGNGPFLRTGFSARLDKAREAGFKGKDWILDLEAEEKKRTSLNTLKIRYNKIVGYFIEISRTQAEQAPKDYLKKQTLVGSERFTTPKLEEIERTILEADEIIQEIERTEFDRMVEEVLKYSSALLSFSEEIGDLDFQISVLTAKDRFGWIRPELSEDRSLNLTDSRHPVVEATLPPGQEFIPNSVYLDTQNQAIAVLTGPNMAGKSTFMRQIALNQILFQMGAFVPAKSAKLPIVDKLFTRIGAGDNLTAGESTFYVEMKETANILNHYTEDSLILFDEVGRGTSTYDGMSIAWSILEYLSSLSVKPKTIFATHYHELTELSRLGGIFNLYLETLEKEDKVLFLRKVKVGKAKKSFGIYVAKIAGIPEPIVKRATELLIDLESKKKEIRIQEAQPTLFTEPESKNFPSETEESILKLKLEEMTPIEALKKLEDFQKKLRKQK